jgi:hypothetical protein
VRQKSEGGAHRPPGTGRRLGNQRVRDLAAEGVPAQNAPAGPIAQFVSKRSPDRVDLAIAPLLQLETGGEVDRSVKRFLSDA